MGNMPFKVFLSYSTDPEESAIVWRLQTLAASHGIQMFVPQRAGIRVPPGRRNVPLLSDEVRAAIESADCVLAIITSRTGPAVEKELNYALGQRKLIIPIVEQGVHEPSFLSKFARVFSFSRLNGNPGRLESEVLEFLRQQKLNKENRQAVGALVAIGAGLLLLSALAKN
jgi:nucleoside 2-deoxyribosyltransferase